MDNWKEYIDQKFIPSDNFIFTEEKGSGSLTIYHIASGTKIHFLSPTNDWKTVGDIQFYNAKTKGWSGEFNSDINFSDNLVKQVDDFLAPVFKFGWVSKDVYLFGRHWKSKVYFSSNMSGHPFNYYSSDLGCLSILFFPLFALTSLIFGQTKIIKIDPIDSFS